MAKPGEMRVRWYSLVSLTSSTLGCPVSGGLERPCYRFRNPQRIIGGIIFELAGQRLRLKPFCPVHSGSKASVLLSATPVFVAVGGGGVCADMEWSLEAETTGDAPEIFIWRRCPVHHCGAARYRFGSSRCWRCAWTPAFYRDVRPERDAVPPWRGAAVCRGPYAACWSRPVVVSRPRPRLRAPIMWPRCSERSRSTVCEHIGMPGAFDTSWLAWRPETASGRRTVAQPGRHGGRADRRLASGGYKPSRPRSRFRFRAPGRASWPTGEFPVGVASGQIRPGLECRL